MNDKNRMKCRFCLTYCNEFCAIEEITRQMLEALLNLNLGLDKGIEMCTECARKLQIAYDFKSTCVNIEKKIIPLFTSKENVKLSEDSSKQNTNLELLDGCEKQRICRFCMKVTESGRHVVLQEKEHIFILDVVQKYIPELHISDTEEIVSCEVCLIALQSFISFIMDCLNVMEKTQNMYESAKSQLELNDIKVFDLKHEIDDDNIAMEKKYDLKNEDVLELGNPELLIKNEETERCVTCFQDTASATHLNLKNNETCKRTVKEHTSQGISGVKVYKCERCSFSANRKYQLTQHMLIHENISEITYKCETCAYLTKCKSNLKRHMLVHQNFPAVPVYKCKTCLYQTYLKGSLKKHMLIHQDVSDVTIYVCESCSFQTKYKSSLKVHLLNHQNLSDVTVHKCEICSYQTKYNDYLKKHMLIHQNLSDVTTYTCETCSYQTKFKRNLKSHMLIHQDPFDVTLHKCETCSFQTKFKQSLKKHMLIHQDPLYKCETCSYQTIYKQSFEKHNMQHIMLISLSDVTVYKCEMCSYHTKFKRNLKRHLPIHHLDVTEYKCETCSFHTKYKRNLKSHMLIHKDLFDVTLYKCETCLYQTKFKRSLKKHMLTHQKLPIFKCETCSYETELKHCLKYHMLVHHGPPDVANTT